MRLQAQKLFAQGSNVDRHKLVETYRAALALKGDVGKGTAIFQKTCAACHQLGNVGNAVGPEACFREDACGRWQPTPADWDDYLVVFSV